MDPFSRKPRVIPTCGICTKEYLDELDFNPNIIENFQFPETSPWVYPMVNLAFSYAKKNQTDPSLYLSLHNEVKDTFRDYDTICFR